MTSRTPKDDAFGVWVSELESAPPTAAEEFASWEPETVLDELEEPYLFTLQTKSLGRMLVYKCNATDVASYFLAVPASDELVRLVRDDDIALRDALRSGEERAWFIERRQDRTLRVRKVSVHRVAPTFLPVPGVTLNRPAPR
jgi:hypothetical protein